MVGRQGARGQLSGESVVADDVRGRCGGIVGTLLRDCGGQGGDEPSLGGVDGPDRGGQIRWAQGSRTDLEEQSDDEGVTA